MIARLKLPEASVKSSSKRSRAKYPALNQSLNTKDRRYFIETDYINGVYDANGQEVIRPLNDEEKAFLNKFYEESLITTFNKDGTDLYNSEEERRQFYNENNCRRRCIFNTAQRTGNLKSLDMVSTDTIYSDIVSDSDKEDTGFAKLIADYVASDDASLEYDIANFNAIKNYDFEITMLIESVLESGDVESAKKLQKILGIEKREKKKKEVK